MIRRFIFSYKTKTKYKTKTSLKKLSVLTKCVKALMIHQGEIYYEKKPFA